MKLRTYLRGLGLGLIVAALVTGVGSRQTMSDEQIKARAKELGMMESNTYLTPVNESEEETTESEESTAETTETQIQDAGTESQESVMETAETVVKPTEEIVEETIAETETESVETVETLESQPQQETESQVAEEEFVTFQVRSGDSSVSVAKRLAEAGLVGDAKAFDQYLCQNGYDKKIRVGTYEIRHDSSNEEIAKAITGK